MIDWNEERRTLVESAFITQSSVVYLREASIVALGGVTVQNSRQAHNALLTVSVWIIGSHSSQRKGSPRMTKFET